MKFRRDHKDAARAAADVAVDATLEADIRGVEQAVADYLAYPGETQRHELLAEIEELDHQTDASDWYASSIRDSAYFGFTSKSQVIGATTSTPFVDEVPGSVFRAQVALVRAAKNALDASSPTSMEELTQAAAALEAARSQTSTGLSGE